jgi:hypothetical protein
MFFIAVLQKISKKKDKEWFQSIIKLIRYGTKSM